MKDLAFNAFAALRKLIKHGRRWFRLLLLPALIGWLSLGCERASTKHADNICRKAELAREEAAYLESNVVKPWAIENGKTTWDTPTLVDIHRYLPNTHPVCQRAWNDPFGNPYVLGAVGDGVAVNAKTIELYAEATRNDPHFWGHHDERVWSLIRATKEGDIAAVRTLVKTVPDLNVPNCFGEKALDLAMANGNEEMEKVLASHGAVLSPGDGSPLWWAIGKKNVKVVKALLDRFPYMATATNTVVGDDGVATTSQLALCVASMGGNTEIVQMLLEHGADPNTASGDPLRSAVIDGHLDIVKLLVEAGAQITPTVLQRAARGDRREICEYLDAHLNAATNGAPSAGAKAGAGQ